MELNINLPLTGSAAGLVRAINASFVQRKATEVIFADDGCYRHITLLMGEVTESDRDVLIERVGLFASETTAFPIPFTCIQRPSVTSPYLSIEVSELKAISNLRICLARQLEGLIALSEYGRPDTMPHITVAYTPQRPQISPFILCRRELSGIPNRLPSRKHAPTAHAFANWLVFG